MKRIAIALLAAVALMVGAPTTGAAQSVAPGPLQAFVSQVARLWANGDADAIVALAPADGRMLLDVGAGTAGPVQPRQAAAALRSVFSSHTTVSVRAERSTVSGGDPVTGFGELRWLCRARGVTTTDTHGVFLGVEWDGRSWRVREIRILG